jgi:exonuclease III
MSDAEDWAYLYSTPLTEHPQTQYTLSELEAIAGIANLAILSMSHYWVLPFRPLLLELQQAVHDLALALWDAFNRSKKSNFTLIPMPIPSPLEPRHCRPPATSNRRTYKLHSDQLDPRTDPPHSDQMNSGEHELGAVSQTSEQINHRHINEICPNNINSPNAPTSVSSQIELQHSNTQEEFCLKGMDLSTVTESDCTRQRQITHTESLLSRSQVTINWKEVTQEDHVHDLLRDNSNITIEEYPQEEESILEVHSDNTPGSEDTESNWTDEHKLLLRCYGMESSNQTRFSLGKISSDRLKGLIKLLMNIERTEAPQVFLEHVWDDPTITFNYWRIRDDKFTEVIPCIASEWYTIAYMRWRFHFEATLDFKDPDDCVRGANMLLFLEEKLSHEIDKDELALIQYANSWLRGPIRHEFLPPHKFNAKLLCSIFGSLRVALFSNPDNKSFIADKRMPEEKWTRLLHNSISTNKGDSVTYREVTEIASSGNFAQLHQELYWPTTYFDDELPRCHSSLANLSERLWDTIHNIQHDQLLSTTRSRRENSTTRSSSNHLQVVKDMIFQSTTDTSNQLFLHPNLSGHLRIASLNIDGLSQHKLPILLLYMEQQHIDILCLQDTRLSEKESRLMAHLVRLRYEHINIQVRFSEVRTDTNCAYTKVGGQMIIILGKWASRVTNFYSDFTGFGVVSGLTVQAQDYKILVVSTYWPPKSKSNDNTQLWTKIEKQLSQHQITLSPLEFARHTIQERFKKHLTGSKDNVALLVGDLNSTWGTTAAGGCHRGLQEWAQSISLSNPLHSHSLLTSNPVHTHWIGRHTLEGTSHEGVSWIDHILVHRNGSPIIVQGGTESNSEWIPVSDHRPIWVNIHLPKGGTSPATQYPTNFLPLRKLNRKNLKTVEKYRAIMLKKTATLSNDLSAEETLKALMKHSVNACPKPGKSTPTFYNCSRFKDGWSPMLVAKLTALTSIVKIRQHVTGENKKALWRSKAAISTGIYAVTSDWEKKLRTLSWSDGMSREKAFSTGLGPTHWRLFPEMDYYKLPNLLREQERQVKKQLHGRQRREDRLSMKNASAAREKSVASGKIAQAIKSILCNHLPQYDLNNLKLSDGTIIVDPIKIHDLQTNHWKKWFSCTGQPTFFDLHHINWSAPQELYDTFIHFEQHSAIPLELLQCIWKAITSPTETHPKLRELLTVSLARPIELEEVKHAIKKAPAGSVPGPSGLSYAMMKEWPEEVVFKFHMALNQIWEQKIIPQEWNIKWLCPKPKIDPEIATLDDLRPLNLLETPRKLLMGIIAIASI